MLRDSRLCQLPRPSFPNGEPHLAVRSGQPGELAVLPGPPGLSVWTPDLVLDRRRPRCHGIRLYRAD